MVKTKHFGRLRDLASISDYTPVDVAQKLKLSDDKQKALMLSNQLQPSKDNSQYVKNIYDQGNLGSCTAFMSKYMYEYMEQRGHNKYSQVSALYIYKMTRRLMYPENPTPGDTGAYIRNALGALSIFGAAPDTVYPYNIGKFDQMPNWDVGAYGQQFQVLKYFRLDKGKAANQQLVDSMKDFISKNFCLGIGFTVFSSYGESNTNGGFFPYPKPGEQVEGGHAITLIGYDDTKEGGCFKLVNSWSTDWGEKGFGWIPYKYFTNNNDANGALADDIWAILKYEWMDTEEFGFFDA